MARVTVEDCAEVVPSRFELVALAAQRTKVISSGAPITVDRDNDKNPVIALREIADRTVDVEALREQVILTCQDKVRMDEYGVEQAHSGEEVGLSSDEIVEDITSYQEQPSAESDDAQSLLYGEENLDAIDD
tara:strand:+ start:833 stop:1228 length:396 start_codon:yes stop_codon:yes gene_type:complete